MPQNLTSNIEKYILSRLEEEANNFVSLRRKELAEKFECVPSQINYVLRSRFTPEQGYIIDSRRGEHGYIKIIKILCVTSDEKIRHLESIIGPSISLTEAHKLLAELENREFITQRERLLIEVSLRNSDIIFESMPQIMPQNERENLFARLLKSMLRGLMRISDDKGEGV